MKTNELKKLAAGEKPGYYVTNIVQYEKYYIAFMQPNGVKQNSEAALMDSYVVINGETGKIEYKSIYTFKGFFKRIKFIE